MATGASRADHHNVNAGKLKAAPETAWAHARAILGNRNWPLRKRQPGERGAQQRFVVGLRVQEEE